MNSKKNLNDLPGEEAHRHILPNINSLIIENGGGNKMHLEKINNNHHQQQQPINNKEEPGKPFRQVIAALIANIGAVNTGLVFGFSAVVIPQLHDKDSFLQIDTNQTSWIASIASLATPLGCIITGWIMDYFGRKKAILITQFPVIIGWIIISFATNIPMIYIGRVLTGLGSGMIGAPARVYTSEVTQPHLRGMLGALSSVAISFGVLFQYTMGAFVSWHILSAISAIFPLSAFIFMLFMPETPNYLVEKTKTEKAIKSLAKLRGSSYNVRNEVQKLQTVADKRKMAQQNTSQFSNTLKVLLSAATLKPFAILTIYFMIYQFSGVNTVTFYAVDIFQSTGTSLNKNVATILLGAIRLIFTIVGCVAMRHYGRRSLTFVSSIGCGVSMVGLGIYFQFKDLWANSNSSIVSSLNSWYPVFCIFIFTMTCTIGFLIVPWVMIGELYPMKVRGTIGGLTTCMAHIFVFVVVKTYPLLVSIFDYHGTFILYGIISLGGTVFFYFYLPETKGKSLQEIEDYFSSKTASLDSSNKELKEIKYSPVITLDKIIEEK